MASLPGEQRARSVLRAAQGDNVFVRQLLCVPSVSEKFAVALVQQFGDLETLQGALRDVKTFPKIQIGKTCLGKARIANLARHLLRDDGGEREAEAPKKYMLAYV